MWKSGRSTKRVVGADPLVAMSMNILVNTYAALGDHRQAAALHVDVLALRKRGVGADLSHVAMIMNNLVNA